MSTGCEVAEAMTPRRKNTAREGLEFLADIAPRGEHALDAFDRGLDEMLDGDRGPETDAEAAALEWFSDGMGELLGFMGTTRGQK